MKHTLLIFLNYHVKIISNKGSNRILNIICVFLIKCLHGNEALSIACRVCHYKNLQINLLYGQVLQLSGQIKSYCRKLNSCRTNRIVMKNCCQQQDKSYRNEKLSAAEHRNAQITCQLLQCAAVS